MGSKVERRESSLDDVLADLYRRNRPALMRYLTGWTNGQRQTAEDLFQETMIRAWRHRASLPPDRDDHRHWLLTVARRLVIDNARRQRVRPAEVELERAATVPATDATAEVVVAAAMLRLAVHRLTPPQREVIAEVYVKGKTLDQAARDLRLPTGTVKSRAHYAVKALRTFLQDPAPVGRMPS